MISNCSNQDKLYLHSISFRLNEIYLRFRALFSSYFFFCKLLITDVTCLPTYFLIFFVLFKNNRQKLILVILHANKCFYSVKFIEDHPPVLTLMQKSAIDITFDNIMFSYFIYSFTIIYIDIMWHFNYIRNLWKISILFIKLLLRFAYICTFHRHFMLSRKNFIQKENDQVASIS